MRTSSHFAPLRIAVFSALVFMTSQCKTPGDGGSTAAPTNDLIVTLSDLISGASIRALSGSDLKKEVVNSSTLYANKPKDPSSPANDQKCSDEAFSSIVFHANGKSGYLAGTADLGPCFRSSFTSTGSIAFNIDALSLSIRFLARIDCANEDLSFLDGKNFQEITKQYEGNSFFCKNYKAMSQNSSQTTMKISYSYAGKSYTQEQESNVYSMKARADGSPCDYTTVGSDIVMTGECIDTTRTVYKVYRNNGVADAKEGKEDFKRITFTQVGEAVTGKPTYYSSGSATLAYNDWNGSITYAGTTATPVWNMKNASQTLSGPLVPTYVTQTTANPSPTPVPATPSSSSANPLGLTDTGTVLQTGLQGISDKLRDLSVGF